MEFHDAEHLSYIIGFLVFLTAFQVVFATQGLRRVAHALLAAPLPNAYHALEPHFDARTMEIHLTKHHQTYVTNLNNAVAEANIADQPVEELIADMQAVPESVRTVARNNGGGHANHALFRTVLKADGGKPSD